MSCKASKKLIASHTTQCANRGKYLQALTDHLLTKFIWGSLCVCVNKAWNSICYIVFVNTLKCHFLTNNWLKGKMNIDQSIHNMLVSVISIFEFILWQLSPFSILASSKITCLMLCILFVVLLYPHRSLDTDRFTFHTNIHAITSRNDDEPTM